MNEGRLIRKIIDIGVMLECGKLDYEGAECDAKAVIKEIRQQCNIADVMESVCRCINWHPSTKLNEGKRAVCSNCKRPRQTVL